MTDRTETHAWSLALAIGILLMLAGIFALAASVLTSFITVIYVGVLLVIVGLLEIVSAFRVRHTGGPFLAYILAGVLSIVVGALFLDRPLVSLASLTLLIAGFLFASGLFRAIIALTERYRHWGWDLLYGAVAVALGALVVITWPFSSFWVLGTVVGAEILVRGITLVAASSRIRELEHRMPRAAV